MSQIKTVTVPVVADAGGNFTIITPRVSGRFLQMRYVAGTLATGTDVTLTGVKTGQLIVNITNIGVANIQRAIRQPTHDNAGVASLYAGAGEPVEDYYFVDEEFTLSIVQGGNGGTGTFHFWFG